jgi:hypothetical protein
MAATFGGICGLLGESGKARWAQWGADSVAPDSPPPVAMVAGKDEDASDAATGQR